MTIYAMLHTTGDVTYVGEICPHADPAGFYTTEVTALFVPVPDGTQQGWIRQDDGSFLAPPSPPPSPPPPPPPLPSLTPMQFYLAFTPPERIAIKTSTDAEVKEFWATFQMAFDTGYPIDPNLSSVQDGLAYLVSQSLIASDRVAQILAGTPQ